MPAQRLIPEIIRRSALEYADRPAVRWAVRKDTEERSYAQLDSARKRVRNAMAARGFSGAHVALIGASSYPWIASYLGLVSGKFTAVPLDAALPEAELVDLLNRSDSQALFLGEKLAGLAPAVRESCPNVRLIVLLREEPSGGADPDAISFGDLLSEADDGDSPDAPAEDDVCTIIYTSGTTGKSKGVMLTQRNLYDNMDNVYVTVKPDTVMLSVLPIHHAYCLVMDWLMGFNKGATLCINDSLLHMIRNIGRFQPDIMLMVPLMIETLCKRLQAAESEGPDAVRAVVGPNLRRIYSGGAHLDPLYIGAMKKYDIDIYEGYGMSECSPTISSNNELGNKPGSVGRPLGNVEARFENGELQVRGSSVMKGYYKMPAETAEALKDGWLHTGDLGHIDEDGFLFITGRLKNLIILSNGENVSPEEVEGHFAPEPLVGEIVVTGESNGLTARIFPDPDYVEQQGLSPDAVQAALQEIIDRYNKSQPTYRAIIKLVVRKYPFLKSATRKIKRPLAEIDAPAET
ncbi:MAG: AMP-binding protein [Oscillibacter sp.]|nr:AMP-binding protein [Oscillibacter sp.]